MKIKISNPLMKFSAGISAYLMSANAYAATGDSLSSVSQMASSNLYQVSDIISTASYVVGAGFGMAGVVALKAHSENPGQTPVSKGAGRIAAGAGLVALPWVINTTFNSIGITESATTGVTGSSNRF